MKLTSNQANKLLRNYQDELDLLIRQANSLSTFVAAVTEDVEAVRPEFDLNDYYIKRTELEDKIRKIKHAINMFNISTVIEAINMTIDEALVALPQYSRKLYVLSNLKGKINRTRLLNRPQCNIIEYEYTNYDVKEAARLFNELNNKVVTIQTELDRINNTVLFDIEL